MTITEKLSEFAGYPIRDFTASGFDPPKQNGKAAPGEDFDPFAMDEPCAVRIRGQDVNSGSCLGCLIALAVGPLTTVILITAFAKTGILQKEMANLVSIVAGIVAFVLFLWFSDRMDARARARQAKEEEQKADLAPLADAESQRVVKTLWRRKSRNAQALARLIHCGAAARVEALLIGFEPDHGFEDLVECMELSLPYLQSVKALFINELISDEAEISWIDCGECGSIASGFPELEHLQIRGGGTALAQLNAPQLRTLILESGGLGAGLLHEIASADLPNLRHLEVWTGQHDFGGDCKIGDVVELLSRPWEQLEHLGIRNCEFADEVIEWLVDQPLLGQLKSLDFSLGCVSDKGAELLLASDKIESLDFLNLHHNYLSDQCVGQLLTLQTDVDVSDQQLEEYDDGVAHRYTAIGE